MNRFNFILFLGCVISFSLSGCNHSTSEIDPNQTQFTPLRTNELIDQQPSNKAKQLIAEFDEISTVKAVNSNKMIVIAFEVDHIQRLQLKKIRQKIEKKVDKKIDNLNLIVSSDKKIILEIEKLEQKIQANEISEKELTQKVDEIIKLSKEQT